ncbi:unnamed protein product [Ilex paraguariensis]|uniref:Uncharacterized protein n=1 Tax=Ilex paraguariensis TaxID=185542 RepID=A0ABC8QQA5_9AQUA
MLLHNGKRAFTTNRKAMGNNLSKEMVAKGLGLMDSDDPFNGMKQLGHQNNHSGLVLPFVRTEGFNTLVQLRSHMLPAENTTSIFFKDPRSKILVKFSSIQVMGL